MNDWYSTLLLIRRRQADIAHQAELHRRLAEAQATGRQGKSSGRLRAKPLSYRFGQMLGMLGRSLQQPRSRIPAA
jgi:hypothetical protein